MSIAALMAALVINGHGDVTVWRPLLCQQRTRIGRWPRPLRANRAIILRVGLEAYSGGRHTPVAMLDQRNSARTDADFDRSQASMTTVKSFLRYYLAGRQGSLFRGCSGHPPITSVIGHRLSPAHIRKKSPQLATGRRVASNY